MNLAQTKHLFFKLLVLQHFFFSDFDKNWGILGGAPIVATIRNQRPSQKVWRLKRPPKFNEKSWKCSIFSKCWLIVLKKLVMFFEIYRNADHQNTNTQTNKWKKQTSKQTNKQSNKETNKQTHKQTHKQANENTSKQLGKQRHKQTIRQTKTQRRKQRNKHATKQKITPRRSKDSKEQRPEETDKQRSAHINIQAYRQHK